MKPSETKERCLYINLSRQLQIVKLGAIGLEKSLFPHESVIFQASVNDFLEVHTLEFVTMTLADKISCANLLCREQSQVW